MKRVEIYTRTFCIWCWRAKLLLFRKGVRFVEHDATTSEVRHALFARTGRRTVPQVFVEGAGIGGYDELAALDGSGRLDALLRGDLARE